MLSVFEPSIVKHIYELAKEPGEIQVKMIYYDNRYSDPFIFYVSLPLDADVEDLKIEIDDTTDFEYCTDAIVIRVHQPWNACYLDLYDDEDVKDYMEEYGELHLIIN